MRRSHTDTISEYRGAHTALFEGTLASTDIQYYFVLTSRAVSHRFPLLTIIAVRPRSRARMRDRNPRR